MSIITVLATITPEEILIEMLEKKLSEYKEAKLLNQDTKKAFEALSFSCTMIVAKSISRDDIDKAMQLDKQAENVMKMAEALKPSN